MKIDNSMVMMLGLAGLGGLMFFMMNKKSEESNQLNQLQMQQLVASIAQRGNVQDPGIQADMYAQLMAAVQKTGSVDKALRDQQLISGYVQLGVGTATQIGTMIASFL